MAAASMVHVDVDYLIGNWSAWKQGLEAGHVGGKAI
jgi:hypothetical protein